MFDGPIPKHSLVHLDSDVLGQTREVAVYLPPNYEKTPQKSFPVLYMPDGGIHEDFPHVVQTIQELAAKGEIPEMLVVGVKNIDRYYDMTTPTEVPELLEKIPEPGGLENFMKFFTDELQPHVEQHYRVQGQPTAIVGESLAGFFVLHGWMSQPQAFDVWIAVDPAVWWNDDELAQSAKQRLAQKKPSSAHRLYVSGAGRAGEGNLATTQALVDELRALGVGSDALVFEPQTEWAHGDIFQGTKELFFTKMLGAWRSDASTTHKLAR